MHERRSLECNWVTPAYGLTLIMHGEFNCDNQFVQFISYGLIQLGNTSSAACFVGPIVTSWVLLLQQCDVIENNEIGNNTAIPLVDKFKLLMNINEWIAHTFQ